MTTRSISQAAADVERTDGADRLELSLWDALLLGRVSATRPGLRVRATDTAPHPNPHPSVVSRQEVV